MSTGVRGLPGGSSAESRLITDRWVARRSLSLELFGTRVSALEVLIGSAIGVVTWPVPDAPVKIGIDTSWIVGLHLAARQGLQFGQDIAFTFGPLGFLGWPEPYVAWTSAAALAFVAAIHLAACLTFLHLVRQSVGLPVATVLVLMVAFTFPWIAGWRLLGVLVFVAVASAFYRRSTRPSGLPLAFGLGVVIGIAALGKLNIAAVALAIATVGVVATARRPGLSLAAFISSGVVAFVALWLVTGQHLGDVPAYFRTSLDIATGYSEFMGADDPSTSWSSGVALLSTFILATLLWQRTSSMPRRERVALRGITALVLFAEYKAGFTQGRSGRRHLRGNLARPVAGCRPSDSLMGHRERAGSGPLRHVPGGVGHPDRDPDRPCRARVGLRVRSRRRPLPSG